MFAWNSWIPWIHKFKKTQKNISQTPLRAIPFSFNSWQWRRRVNQWFTHASRNSTLIAGINTPTQRYHTRDNHVRWLRLRVTSLPWVKWKGYRCGCVESRVVWFNGRTTYLTRWDRSQWSRIISSDYRWIVCVCLFLKFLAWFYLLFSQTMGWFVVVVPMANGAGAGCWCCVVVLNLCRSSRCAQHDAVSYMHWYIL